MSEQLKFFLNANRSSPQIERFARNGNDLILKLLESEIDRNLLGLSKLPFQVTGCVRATPEKNSHKLSNPALESIQDIGISDSSIDLEFQGFPIGRELSYGLKLLITNSAFPNGKEEALAVDTDFVKIQGKVEAEFKITLTLGFPELSGADFDLVVISAQSLEEIPTTGKSMVIIAMVDSKIHIRIFDTVGTMVVEKGERALGKGANLTTLKWIFDSSSPVFHEKLSATNRVMFSKRAIAISSPLKIKLKGRATSTIKDNVTLQVSSG